MRLLGLPSGEEDGELESQTVASPTRFPGGTRAPVGFILRKTREGIEPSFDCFAGSNLATRSPSRKEGGRVELL